ncbi:MAG: sigma-70 family RNA polymerase sigma factor [Candidatus Sumerlaeia bacterium]|nr:sigma-70 family RNA polymerase sigma factor [Candidatus Sumerlaeia bacterium]
MSDLSKEEGRDLAREEKLLLASARQGDPDAMGRLLLLYQDRVFRTALHLLGGDHDTAADAAQETLLSAWRHFGRFRGESSFSTWIYRIAVNCARNARTVTSRNAARFVPLGGEADDDPDKPPRPTPATTGPNPRQQAVGEEMMRHLRENLGQLEPEFREPLVLRYIEDHSYEEIADILEVPLGTIKSRINRGRRELRHAMAEHLGRKGEAS